MPRQPLRAATRYPDLAISLGPDSLDERPAHVALIGQCLALWPEIENQQAIMLAALLKTDTAGAVALYHSLRRSTQKMVALEAASTDRLHGREREMFEAVLKIIQSAETERNFYAQALYGHCDTMPDSIICLDQTSYARFAVRHLGNPRHSWRYSDDEAKEIIENAYHPTRENIRRFRLELEECFAVAFNFNSLVLERNRCGSGEEQFAELAQTKSVADTLLRLRQAAAQKANEFVLDHVVSAGAGLSRHKLALVCATSR